MYKVENGNILIPIDCITAKFTRDDDYYYIDEIEVGAEGLPKKMLKEVGESIRENLSDSVHDYRELWQDEFRDEIRRSTGVYDIEFDFEED